VLIDFPVAWGTHAELAFCVCQKSSGALNSFFSQVAVPSFCFGDSAIASLLGKEAVPEVPPSLFFVLFFSFY